MQPPLPDTIALPTPCLVIEAATLRRNLKAMQRACAEGGVQLRAHGKMHKCPDLARLQIAQGAVGLCAQTIGEAEAFASAGIGDILISAPITLLDAPRAAALARCTTLSVCADSAALIDALAAAAQAAEVEMGLMIDLNVGHHRTGAPLSAAIALARRAAQAQSLHFAGLQAYHGAIQHLEAAERAAMAHHVANKLRPLIAELAAQGLKPPHITGGGTGTFATDLAGGVFTELQCGSYALMDAEYSDVGAPFEPALFLAATVVSAAAKTHVVIDAGLKALALEVAPRILAGAPDGAKFQFAGDEHARLLHPAFPAIHARDLRAQFAAFEAAALAHDYPYPDDLPRLGARVWLQPGHVDPTINLHSHLIIAEDGAIVDRWPITARR